MFKRWTIDPNFLSTSYSSNLEDLSSLTPRPISSFIYQGAHHVPADHWSPIVSYLVISEGDVLDCLRSFHRERYYQWFIWPFRHLLYYPQDCPPGSFAHHSVSSRPGYFRRHQLLFDLPLPWMHFNPLPTHHTWRVTRGEATPAFWYTAGRLASANDSPS